MASAISSSGAVPGKERFIAVRMKAMYCHDDTVNEYDDSLKSNDTLTIFDGEDGFLIRESPDGQWALVQFRRHSRSFNVFIPKPFLILGSEYRTVSEQVERLGDNKRLHDMSPLTLDASGPLPSCPTTFETYIRTLWMVLRENAEWLTTLGLDKAIAADMFGDKFSANVDNLVAAFEPAAQVLAKPDGFSIRDLTRLRPVTSSWPGLISTIYMRVYTHQDRLHQDEDDAAVYIGMSINAWYRLICHDRSHALQANGTNMGIHYQNAQVSPANCRRMIPLMIQTRDWSRTQFAMAEQTGTLLLNAYSPQVMGNKIELNEGYGPAGLSGFASYRAQAQFLQGINRTVQARVGWKPPAMLGCNVLSPLFGVSRLGTKYIQKTHVREPDPSGRHRTIYRIAARWTPWSPSKTRQVLLWRLTYHAREEKTGERSKVRHWTFLLKKSVYDAAGIPFEPLDSIVRFEIMDDSRPHPKAYVGVPAVGPYSNMEQASSLGIFVEWYSSAKDTWYSMPMQLGHLPSLKVYREKDPARSVLIPYQKCMDIMQMLQGKLYEFEESAEPSDSLFRSIISHDQVTYYTADHLAQEISFQQYATPNVRTPAPRKQTYEENWELMVRLFNQAGTVVGLRPDPATHPDYFMVRPNGARKNPIYPPKSKADLKCDCCQLLNKNIATVQPCVPVPGKESTCGFCTILGRPCTYTPRALLFDYAEGSSQHPTQPGHSRLSRALNGPYRSLIYYRTMSAEEESTPVVIDKPFGADELMNRQTDEETEEGAEEEAGEEAGEDIGGDEDEAD